MKRIITSFLLSAAVLLLAGCAREKPGGTVEERADVTVSFTGDGAWFTRALTDSHTVDRILLIPFTKIDPSGTDTPENFTPDMTMIEQIEVSTFPVSATLSLSEGLEYRVMAIGYNNFDMDFTVTGLTGHTIGMVFAGSPPTIANLAIGLSAPYPTPYAVPDIFGCYCTDSTMNTTFVASDNVSLTGELNRYLSGLEVEINNIPEEVTSISLLAEILSSTILVHDQTPILYDVAPDTDNNLLGTQTPSAETVAFDSKQLPTPADFPTKLYLDVTKGDETERFEIKVEDLEGVVLDNAFYLLPNRIISIVGDYDKIDFGFTISIGDGINLDDDTWDGL